MEPQPATSTLARPTAKLTVARPGQPPHEYYCLRSSLVIGRVRTCDLILDGDTLVSREHCRLEVDLLTGALHIQDLNSSNGTFLNSQPVGGTLVEVVPGAVLQVGSTLLTYSVERVSPAALAPKLLKPAKLPLPPREGEAERTRFADGFCFCGRCGAAIPTGRLRLGDKVGCPQCRAVWRYGKEKG